MPSLVDRLQQLAVDAARLAQEIAARDDLVRQLAAEFGRHGLSITHAGHALFDAVGVRFAGAPPFDLEEVLVRSTGQEIVIEHQGPIAWLAMFKRVKVDHDILIGMDLELGPGTTLGAFVRSQQPGRYLDGTAVRADSGAVSLNRLLPHPEAVGGDARNYAYLVFDQVAAPIRLGSLVLNEVAGSSRRAAVAPEPIKDR